MKQEMTVDGACQSRQIAMPAPHYSFFLQVWCSSWRPTNSVKAVKVKGHCTWIQLIIGLWWWEPGHVITSIAPVLHDFNWLFVHPCVIFKLVTTGFVFGQQTALEICWHLSGSHSENKKCTRCQTLCSLQCSSHKLFRQPYKYHC